MRKARALPFKVTAAALDEIIEVATLGFCDNCDTIDVCDNFTAVNDPTMSGESMSLCEECLHGV